MECQSLKSLEIINWNKMENNLKIHATYAESRRSFFKNSALVGVGIMFLPEAILGNTQMPAPGLLGERLTSLAIADDIFRLVKASSEISETIKKVVEPHINEHVPGNTARLARNIPGLEKQSINILKIAREGIQKKDEFAGEKLALALGAIAFQTVNQELKSFGAIIKGNGSETGLYMDASVLKAMNGIGLTENVNGDADDLASLFKGITPRVLTRFHTLIPDDDDAENWIISMFDWRHETDMYYNKLAALYTQPDKKKLESLIIKPGFLNTQDELYTAARGLRQNNHSETARLQTAFAKAENQSMYTRALARGYSNVNMAAAYFEGKMDEKELVKRLAFS
jgi:hypothetical protein